MNHRIYRTPFSLYTMEFLKELLLFVKTRKIYWLLPLILLLLLLAVMVVISSSSALAPFIYTLF